MRSHKHHIYVYPSFERGLDVTNDICYTKTSTNCKKAYLEFTLIYLPLFS